MNTEDEVITSPLSRALDIEGIHLTIVVYRGTFSDDDWFFEIVDSEGNTNVSETMYTTDQDAFDAAIHTVHATH